MASRRWSPAGRDVDQALSAVLVRSGDAWRSSCVLDAVRSDGRDVLSDADAHTAVRRAVEAGVETQLLWAERGLLDEPQGLYDETRLRALDLPAALRTREVAGSDHYSVILVPSAITVLADAVDGQLATR